MRRGCFDLDADVLSSVIKINTMGTLIPSRVFARQMAGKDGGFSAHPGI